MSLTPEEMSWAQKLREDIGKFSRVVLLQEEVKQIADELERLQLIEQICGEECNQCGWGGIRGNDPCAYCQLSTYKEALEAAEIELLRARNTLEAFEYQLAQTKLVEGIYAALTQVRKVLGKV